MLVGLGTGSTAACAVRRLGDRVAAGLEVTAIATSTSIETLARSVGIPVLPFDAVSRLDITIDGADEIDPELRAIKGGGGALLREKVAASASDRVIVIVDSSKAVTRLGRFHLPVAVVPFADAYVEKSLRRFGVPVARRMTLDGPFLTDEGNHIFDISFGSIADAESLAAELKAIPGLVEHGLFLSEIHMAVIARGSTIETRQRQGAGGLIAGS